MKKFLEGSENGHIALFPLIVPKMEGDPMRVVLTHGRKFVGFFFFNKNLQVMRTLLFIGELAPFYITNLRRVMPLDLSRLQPFTKQCNLHHVKQTILLWV